MSDKEKKNTSMQEAIKDVEGEIETPKLPVKAKKSFSDVNEKIEFYPELEKVEFNTLLDIEITVIDAKLIRDFDSQFGKHDFMIVRAANQGQEFTFGTSGVVLIKRIMTAKEKRQLPLTGIISKPEGKAYYDIN